MMGSEYHLHLNNKGQDVIVKVQTTELDTKHKHGFSYNEEINITLGRDLVHLFNKETKVNLI